MCLYIDMYSCRSRTCSRRASCGSQCGMIGGYIDRQIDAYIHIYRYMYIVYTYISHLLERAFDFVFAHGLLHVACNVD